MMAAATLAALAVRHALEQAATVVIPFVVPVDVEAKSQPCILVDVHDGTKIRYIH